MLRQRLAAALHGADPRVCTAFWLFGLINNVLYVIILSAALDLVGPSRQKSIVLLFDVIPSFLTKLLAPYFIHVLSYRVRVLLFAAISTVGMLLIALSPGYTDGGSIAIKMVGVMLASLSSGGGELSFLGLTHYYGRFSLAAWGSGTGAAGLVGAGAYALATTGLGMSVRAALLTSSFLPLVMLASFFLVLPPTPTEMKRYERAGSPAQGAHLGSNIEDEDTPDTETLLSPPSRTTAPPTSWDKLQSNLSRSKSLFIPYMLPLLLVYIAEYTINQGVSPTLLFDIESPGTPFTEYRSFYPTYNAIYQIGVFISRSSTPVLRIHNLYLPSILQVVNLALLITQSLTSFIPSVWLIFLVIFWEGLLGGAVYVNTFAEILDNVPGRNREFSLGATSVSDSGGICIAGFLSLALEPFLCGWQVSRGKDWCKRI